MDGNQPVAVAGLTFYGDASGKDETEGLAVGGFVGTVEGCGALLLRTLPFPVVCPVL